MNILLWVLQALGALLAAESCVFIAAHVQYREIAATILSGGLGLLMAFIVYGRVVLQAGV
jgi:hypothetical protein